MKEAEKPRKLYVVIDTNVFVQGTNMLRSPMGAALLYEVHNSGAKIGLPEVIELEVMKHSVAKGLKAIEDIKKGYEIIEILVGNRDDYQIPNKEEIHRYASDGMAGRFP